MGQIKKVGDVYYIEFYARGLMYTQAAGASIEEARTMLEGVEAKIALGESLTTVRDIELGVFFDRFLLYANEKFSPKSVERFKSFWNHWIVFLSKFDPGIQRLSQITPSVIESYKAKLVETRQSKIVNLTILLLREVLEYGIRIGYINDNPSLHITLVKVPFKNLKMSQRTEVAKDLLSRSISLEKVYFILKLKDVAQVMYWSNFIPLKREDIYR